MSYLNFRQALRLSAKDPDFDTLLYALMLKADTDHLITLQRAFPEEWSELQKRWNAPRGGHLPEDRKKKPSPEPQIRKPTNVEKRISSERERQSRKQPRF